MGLVGAPAEWGPLVDAEVFAPITAFSARHHELVHCSFVTGSYARGTHQVNRPNVNIYFVAALRRAAELRLALATLWDDIREGLRVRGIDLIIDCHPYSVPFRDEAMAGTPALTITTKVFEIEAAAQRFRLPAPIGRGYADLRLELFGDSSLLTSLRDPPTDPRDWVQAVHEALSRYRNMLDHLPWALPWRRHPGMLVEECLRYAEEIVKDSPRFTMSLQDLIDGKHSDLVHHWRERSPEFFERHFGAPGLEALAAVEQMKKTAMAGREISPNEAQAHWFETLAIWDLVWQRYLTWLPGVLTDPEASLLRVNAFV